MADADGGAPTPPYADKRVRRTFSQAFGDDVLKWERSGPDCPATAFVHEDNLTVNLQVESRAGPGNEKSRRGGRTPQAAPNADHRQKLSATASLSGRAERSKFRRAIAAFVGALGASDGPNDRLRNARPQVTVAVVSDRRARTRPVLVWTNPSDSRPFPRRKIAAPRARDDPWLGLPVDLPAGPAILYVARSAGVSLWLSSPTELNFNIPPELPKRLTDALTLA